MPSASGARLQALFATALELSDTEREAFLVEACAGDAALLQELRALLAVDEQLGNRTAQPFASGLGRLVSEIASDSAASGQRVGHFELREELGRGGMGRVFRAERVDSDVRQQVAIKFVRREWLHPEMLERFQQERRILAGLSHPNIARLYDTDELQDGTPYYVMEYIDGLPIDEYCRRADLNVRQRVELMRAVCGAVIESHHHLIVHRDLKPSNILVTAAGVPKLLDFGIAKPLDGPVSDNLAQQTGTAQRYFSPQYAAPEQVLGAPIGVACDVYGLGLLLYELLGGQRPFDLTDVSAGQAERLICEVPPVAPSAALAQSKTALARSRASALRGDLDDIVMRCLRKAPHERYASVELLQSDLDNYLQGRPVLARGGHTAYRVRKFIGRHRLGVGAAAVVALLVIAFVTALVLQAQRLQVERDSARQERDRADQVAQFLGEVFKSADPTESLSRDTPVSTVLDNGLHRLQTQLSDAPALRRRLLITMAGVYQNLDDDKTAAKLLDDAEPLVLTGTVADLRAQAEYFGARARTQHSQGDLPASLTTVRKALSIYRELGDPLATYVDVAKLEADDVAEAQTQGHELTLQMYRQLLADYATDPQADPRVLSKLEINMAHYVLYEGSADECEALARRAIARLEPIVPPNDLQLAMGRQQLAAVLDDRRGRPAEALKLLEQARESQTAVLGPRSNAVAHTVNEIGIGLQHLERYDEALKAFHEARGIFQERHPGPHPDNMAIAYNIGSLHEQMKNYDAAADSYEEAWHIVEAVSPVHSANAAAARASVGGMRMHQGRLQEAATLLGEALEDLGYESRDALAIAVNYAEVLWRLKRREEAERVLEHIKPTMEGAKADWPQIYRGYQTLCDKLAGKAPQVNGDVL